MITTRAPDGANKWQGNQLGFEEITDKEDAKIKTDILGLKLAFSAYMQI